MKSKILALLNLGCDPNYSVEKNKSIRMINTYSYLAVGNVIPVTFFLFFLDLKALAIVHLVFILTTFTLWLYNVQGKIRFAKPVIVTSMFITIFFINTALPLSANFFTYFFSVSLVPFLLFNLKELSGLVFSLLFGTVLYAALLLQLDIFAPLQSNILAEFGIEKPFAFGGGLMAFITNIGIVAGFYVAMNQSEKQILSQQDKIFEQSQAIQSMLKNIKQGIFTFESNFLVEDQFSQFMEVIFKGKAIAGSSIFELLFENSSLNVNDRDQIIATLNASLGYSPLAYEVNSHLLPIEFSKIIEGKMYFLEIDWQPIMDGETITKFMVVIRDTTELMRLKEDKNEKMLELRRVGEILAIGTDKYQSFSKQIADSLASIKEIIAKKSQSPEIMRDLFIRMHTLKGVARTFDLSQLVETIHNTESYYSELRGNTDKQWDFTRMLTDIQQIEKHLEGYNATAFQTLKIHNSTSSKYAPLLTYVSQQVQLVKSSTPAAENSKILDTILFRLKNMDWLLLSEIIDSELGALAGLANKLGKPAVIVKINDGDFLFKGKVQPKLQSVFSHLLGNCLDHGIEPAEARKRIGKKESGSIYINVHANGPVSIEIYDDGRGLNLTALKEKSAISKLNDDEIAQQIFNSGVSTATTVTDISGRGVGMDAVRTLLREMGGDIKISWRQPRSVDGFREFAFVCVLPEDCGFRLESTRH